MRILIDPAYLLAAAAISPIVVYRMLRHKRYRAGKLYGAQFAVFYFPLDFLLTMQRAFENIRPSMCSLMEFEVWPNFAQIAHDSNIPVVVVNGRISDNSLGKYKLVKPVMKKIFQNITLIFGRHWLEQAAP